MERIDVCLTVTQAGMVEVDVLEQFEYLGEWFVIHKYLLLEGYFACTHIETGLMVNATATPSVEATREKAKKVLEAWLKTNQLQDREFNLQSYFLTVKNSPVTLFLNGLWIGAK
jgi:hypothetical protein